MPSAVLYRTVGLQFGLQAAALTVAFCCKRNAMLHAAGKAGGVQAHLRYLERERVLAGVRVLSEVTG
jgi:hypothetical protein